MLLFVWVGAILLSLNLQKRPYCKKKLKLPHLCPTFIHHISKIWEGVLQFWFIWLFAKCEMSQRNLKGFTLVKNPINVYILWKKNYKFKWIRDPEIFKKETFAVFFLKMSICSASVNFRIQKIAPKNQQLCLMFIAHFKLKWTTWLKHCEMPNNSDWTPMKSIISECMASD